LAGDNSSDRHRIPLVRSDIIDARLYQETIAEKILQRNTLVVLPTALGKTVIAALACASSLYNFKHKRVLVMAPTRPLVLQHHETYTRLLKLPAIDMVTLTGKTPAVYRKLVWNGTAKIVFATPQIVKNDIENQILTLTDFGLLVFDECHRARKDYAYTSVAKKYVAQSSWPIMLGMTASPGADKERIIDMCKALFIEQIEYRSEEDPEVTPYIFEVEVERRLVDLPNEYREIGRTIRAMLDDRINQLSRTGLIRTATKRVTRKGLLALGEQLRELNSTTISFSDTVSCN
jgi:Fanconi anemia group M protein